MICRNMRVFNSRNKDVRRLKRLYSPSVHGNRVWGTTWLLIDYLNQCGMSVGGRVMDVGCGWGVAGIFCIKKFDATVTCVDIDWDVYPFINLHSDANNVSTTFLNLGYEELTEKHLKNIDVLIGADICFWEKLVEPLKTLIRKSLDAGVERIILADPGRPTFNEVGDFVMDNNLGAQYYWRAVMPYRLQGQIIDIGSDDRFK